MAATKSTTEATAATAAEIAARGATDETGLGFTVLLIVSVWNPSFSILVSGIPRGHKQDDPSSFDC